MSKPLVVITGKNGQLGWELFQLAEGYQDQFEFLFTGRDELDLSNPETISDFFEKVQPDYFINCAAYTAVDKAEQENALAYKTNALSVGEIAKYCAAAHAKLITISTDYVFDGSGTEPYQINTKTNPVNYYGYSKWVGEQLAMANCPETIVIRTSWVYSTHGNNFVKTMLRLMKDRTDLNVVSDQIGSPTYAADLADAIFKMLVSIELGNAHYGIFHFSNSGVISWFDFATAIAAKGGMNCTVHPIPSTAYPTPAKRPSYSVMDCSRVTADYNIHLKPWEQSLAFCISKL